MYSLCIVDDEFYVRKGIIGLIDWQELDISTPFEASSGVEFLEILKKEAIDIAIIDINMPGMNGIELIKQIREEKKDLEIIILSCQSDFEYAREAVSLSVSDYLFKPAMMTEDIIKAINKTSSVIREKRKKDNLIHSTQRYRTISQLRNNLIQDLVEGKVISYGDVKEKIPELDFRFSNKELSLLVLQLNTHLVENEYLFNINLEESFQELISQYGAVELVCLDLNHEYLFIIPHEIDCDTEERILHCRLLSEKIDESVTNVLNIEVLMGISYHKHTIPQIRKGYQEAFYALNSIDSFEGTTKFFGRTCLAVQLDSSLVTRILTLHDEMEESNLPKNLDDIYKILIDAGCRDNRLFSELNRTILIRMKHIYSQDQNALEYLDSVISEIQNSKSRDPAQSKQILMSCLDELSKAEAPRYRKEVTEAISFMKDNIKLPELNLQLVSDKVQISKNYLSKLFKDETGETFIRFLTKLRISKAEELYHTTNMKVYTIAEMVGYSDWRYFSKIYKKYTGKTFTSDKR